MPFLSSHAIVCFSSKQMELPSEAVTTLYFLEAYSICSEIGRTQLTEYIPETILTHYKHLAVKTT